MCRNVDIFEVTVDIIG
ncbi:Protein of unknown function [Bacillus cereus]|nr:Protein of unknown function [Bacillus cereus]